MEIADILPAGSLNNEVWIFVFLFASLFFSKIRRDGFRKFLLIFLSILFALAINSYSSILFFGFFLSVILNFFFYKFLNNSKYVLHFGVIFNLTLLFFAKYYIFILNSFGFVPLFENLNKLFLFAGLSFFVFSMIASLIQASKTDEQKVGFFDFIIYSIFFPRILMGPIITVGQFSKSFEEPNEISNKLGIFLFMFGFSKKVLADFLFLYPSLVFANPDGYSGSVHILSVFGYAAQLYLDFSGYTLMAIGLALIFGYKLPENFNRPYLALSISQFWQRWHITLSDWLKSYVYIPLGGSRFGLPRLYFALFITFVASGIWHGVGFNYLIWGVWHGIGIIIHKSWTLAGFVMPKILSWLLTFFFVCFGWILFIYTDLKNIEIVLQAILYNFDLTIIPSVFMANLEWSVMFFVAWFLILAPVKFLKKIEQLIFDSNIFIQFLIILMILYASVYVKTIVVAPFIYESF